MIQALERWIKAPGIRASDCRLNCNSRPAIDLANHLHSECKLWSENKIWRLWIVRFQKYTSYSYHSWTTLGQASLSFKSVDKILWYYHSIKTSLGEICIVLFISWDFDKRNLIFGGIFIFCHKYEWMYSHRPEVKMTTFFVALVNLAILLRF